MAKRILTNAVREYMAAIGTRGGAVSTDAKAAAARANGAKGGRPRKKRTTN